MFFFSLIQFLNILWWFWRYNGWNSWGTCGSWCTFSWWCNSWDFRVLQDSTILTVEFRAAVWETGVLVGFLWEFALGVWFWKRSAVFNQFEKSARVVFRWDTGGPSAEWVQFPALAWLNGSAFCRCETESREI